MTVKELIKHLSELDPELPVFTYGYEGGYNDLEKVLQEGWFYACKIRR